MNIEVLIIVIVFAAIVLSIISLNTKNIPKGIDKKYFIHEWGDITDQFKSDDTRSLSIINADKLLDEALKGLAYKGSNMAERLVSAKGKFKQREAVWKAHKLRNRVVHDVKVKVTENQARDALKSYYRAFKDLGVF